MAENETDAGNEPEAPVAKLGMVQMIMVAVIAIVASVAASFTMSILTAPAPETAMEEGEEIAPEDRGVANYLPLDPALVVNLDDDGQSRFLQTTVQIMTHDEEVFDAARTHSPAIRAELIMLLGTIEYQSVTTREGKEELQERARQVADEVLMELSGLKGIEALYLTSFVVQ